MPLKKRKDGKFDTGRPIKFKSVVELQKQIDKYFERCDKGRIITTIYKGEPVEYVKPIPYTVSGLAAWLGTNRQTIINYEEKEEFFDVIKSAKEKIEANMEELSTMGESNPTMTIFSLKNNYKRVDKSEVDTKHSGSIDVVDYSKLSEEELEQRRKLLLGGQKE